MHNDVGQVTQVSRNHHRLQEELKCLRRLGAYLGTFTFFYFPVEVLGIIENICDFSAQQWYLDGFVSVKVWLVVLGYSSSAFNPILYGLSTNAWRQAILACLRCKRLNNVFPSTSFGTNAIFSVGNVH